MIGYVMSSLNISQQNFTTLVIRRVVDSRLLVPHTVYAFLLSHGALL